MALFSGTTRVSLYKKGKTNLDFTEAIDSEWQWHQLGHMQVCTSLQTDNHANTHHSVFLQAWTTQFFTGQMLFLPPNQQRQSTEGTGYQRVNIAPDYRQVKNCKKKFYNSLFFCSVQRSVTRSCKCWHILNKVSVIKLCLAFFWFWAVYWPPVEGVLSYTKSREEMVTYNVHLTCKV